MAKAKERSNFLPRQILCFQRGSPKYYVFLPIRENFSKRTSQDIVGSMGFEDDEGYQIRAKL